MKPAHCANTNRAMLPATRRFNRISPRLIAAVFILAGASVGAFASEPDGTINAARRNELINMVRQDCGSCHGLTLKGGLGPALLPQTLQGKPAESLKATILQGRPGTAMPPWRPFMNEAEAEWIVTNLQKGFPGD
ncbi:MAG TPA: cytochrome c [Noviherbaspirillum sp.]|nr:cytochrome c [Noviherbaspirillum sp.]